jgi:plasmid stabilization system protein ParE
MAHQLAPEARNDLTDIWDYVSKESSNPDIADRLIDSISQRFHSLSNQREMSFYLEREASRSGNT